MGTINARVEYGPQVWRTASTRGQSLSTLPTLLDRDAWWKQHDAGRLGANGRGGGQELEDPPAGPIPLTGSGLAGGAFGVIGGVFSALGSVLRLVSAALLSRSRRGRKS